MCVRCQEGLQRVRSVGTVGKGCPQIAFAQFCTYGIGRREGRWRSVGEVGTVLRVLGKVPEVTGGL